jgi:hypothetical protein
MQRGALYGGVCSQGCGAEVRRDGQYQTRCCGLMCSLGRVMENGRLSEGKRWSALKRRRRRAGSYSAPASSLELCFCELVCRVCEVCVDEHAPRVCERERERAFGA